MKIAPVSLYKGYNPFLGKLQPQCPVKEKFQYLLPSSTLERSKIDEAKMDEFNGKPMPRVATPCGRTFVVDRRRHPNGKKDYSTVYELPLTNSSERMLCLYDGNEKLRLAITKHGQDFEGLHGHNTLRLNLKRKDIGKSENAYPWTKILGYNVAQGTIEDYLTHLNTAC